MSLLAFVGSAAYGENMIGFVILSAVMAWTLSFGNASAFVVHDKVAFAAAGFFQRLLITLIIIMALLAFLHVLLVHLIVRTFNVFATACLITTLENTSEASAAMKRVPRLRLKLITEEFEYNYILVQKTLSSKFSCQKRATSTI